MHMVQKTSVSNDPFVEWLRRNVDRSKGLSQSALGRMAGLEHNAINKVLHGTRLLKTHEVVRMAAHIREPTPIIVGENLTLRRIPVTLALRADTWSAQMPTPEATFDVFMPDYEDLTGFRLYAAELQGDPEHSAVVMLSVDEVTEEPVVGKRYHVERLRADGAREATIRRLTQAPDGTLWLKPDSDDPRAGAAIPMNGDGETTVRLLGRVVFAGRRE
jgi:hypothetical protein